MVEDNVITSADAFIVKDDKVLVAHRAADDDFLPCYWELVGGGVEPGETPEDAVVREVKEETNLDVASLGPIFAKTYPEKMELLSIYYLCKSYYFD